MHGWAKRSEVNSTINKKRRIATSAWASMAKKRCLVLWEKGTIRMKQMRDAGEAVYRNRVLSIMKKYFEKIRLRYERRQRYEIERGTAFFKYSQKLLKGSFETLREFAVKSVS